MPNLFVIAAAFGLAIMFGLFDFLSQTNCAPVQTPGSTLIILGFEQTAWNRCLLHHRSLTRLGDAALGKSDLLLYKVRLGIR